MSYKLYRALFFHAYLKNTRHNLQLTTQNAELIKEIICLHSFVLKVSGGVSF